MKYFNFKFKKVLVLSLALMSSLNIIKAQGLTGSYINFPDSNFRIGLTWAGYDLNKDGEIDTTEANKIISLNIGGALLPNHKLLTANDLTGIEYFTNLNDLYCLGFKIENIDLSKNFKIKSISLHSIKLKNLNVKNCINLNYINCEKNLISTLDISKNKNLKVIILSKDTMLKTVCVWTLPFPPDTSIKVDTSGSPNVKFDTICKSGDTTGIRENKQIHVFSFYPNPASNKLFLSEISDIEIYSIDGKLLIRKKSAKDVDINNLSKGLYFVKLTAGSEIRVEKFVKE